MSHVYYSQGKLPRLKHAPALINYNPPPQPPSVLKRNDMLSPNGSELGSRTARLMQSFNIVITEGKKHASKKAKSTGVTNINTIAVSAA